MRTAVDVVYRDLDQSAALTEMINRRFGKLTRFCDDILRSRIVLDTPHNHKHKGKQYRASIALELKGQPLAVARNDESIHVAVREAFDTAERKVKAFNERQRVSRH